MSLTWFWLSLGFAFWNSILISIVKRLTQKVHPLLYLLVGFITSIPFLLILVYITGGVPHVYPKFYSLLFLDTILDSLAAISSTVAIMISPISLISPISAFNPLFTTIIAWISLHEDPTPVKLLGILIVVIGSYLLNIRDIKNGLFYPFKKLYSHRGVQLYLIAQLLWGITPIIQKAAIAQTQPPSPIFTAFFIWLLMTAVILPIVLLKVKNPIGELKGTWLIFLLLAPIGTLATWAAFTAFTLANLGEVTSVFKLSVLFTILWGFIFFKEERILDRLVGAGVMIAGTLLLVI